jgi:hypothetical protein
VSTIPAALDAMLAAFRAALPGVQVLDGPDVADWEDELVIVGWSEQLPSVAVDLARQSAGVDDRETYDVACHISVVSGDTVLRPPRLRAFELFDSLVAELRRDQTLGGVVMRARPAVVDLDQVQLEGEETAGGASVALTFVVSCDAFAY